MKRISLIVGMISVILLLSSCVTQTTNKNSITVAVSVVPQAAFVKAVAGDLVDVVTMIPPGYSPANYQPTPKLMADFDKAQLYFGIGVPTEVTNIMPIADNNPQMKVIHLDDIVGDVYPHRYFDEDEHEGEEHEDEDHEGEEAHEHSGKDPHLWLSPKRAVVMVEVIRDELIAIDQANKSTYESNAAAYIEKLKAVDERLSKELSDAPKKVFMMYHPSLGYFAEDYGLEMIAIEASGKEATSKQLQTIIDFAKQNQLKDVFYQDEFDSAQAEILAREIGGNAIKLSPLSENYLDNLDIMKDLIKNQQ